MQIGCEQCEHSFTLLLHNHTSTTLWLISIRCATHMPSYYNLAWRWWADSCCSPSQMTVGNSTYNAARVLFHTGDASSPDQHAIAVVHVVEFVYLTHSSVNVLMTSCKVINHTLTEPCRKWTTTVSCTVLAWFSSLLARFGCIHATGKNCSVPC